MNASTPIARKEHSCTECGLTIEKGEKYYKYTYFRGDYDFDHLTEFKLHRFCKEVCSEHHARHGLCPDEGVELHEALDELWEEWGVASYLRECDRLDLHKRHHARVLAGETGYSEYQVRNFAENAARPYPKFYFDDEKED